MTKIIPELNFLLNLVEKHYGRHIATSTDFESLSVIIERETGELLSASTLKRIYGYVTMKPIPRKSTLDILCRYIGKKSYDHLRADLKDSKAFTSTFFSTKTLYSSQLKRGDIVRIGWEPNRVVRLKYLGDDSYEVIESLNSQLEKGDKFIQVNFMLGYPLYISRILRGEEYTPSYIAGVRNGINLLETE